MSRDPGIGWQFSLRGMLLGVTAVCVVLVGYREGPWWGAALGGLLGGMTLILVACLSERDGQRRAAHLLLGALCFSAVCGVMFAVAYAQWVSLNSGALDLVTFAAVLFAVTFAFWNPEPSGPRGRSGPLVGYFAWIAGTLILNHLLFQTIIRHLR